MYGACVSPGMPRGEPTHLFVQYWHQLARRVFLNSHLLSKHNNHNNNLNNSIDSYDTSIRYQHTHSPLQNNIHVSKVHCRSVDVRFGRDCADYLRISLAPLVFFVFCFSSFVAAKPEPTLSEGTPAILKKKRGCVPCSLGSLMRKPDCNDSPRVIKQTWSNTWLEITSSKFRAKKKRVGSGKVKK